ncbi:MAG: hypothetical protein ACK6BN_16000 [Pseudanabaena sp.]
MWSGQFCGGDELVDLIVDLVSAGTMRSLRAILPNKNLLPLNSVTSLLVAPIVVWTILRR